MEKLQTETVGTALTVTVTVSGSVPPRESLTMTQYVVVDVSAAVVYVLDDADWSEEPEQLVPE